MKKELFMNCCAVLYDVLAEYEARTHMREYIERRVSYNRISWRADGEHFYLHLQK